MRQSAEHGVDARPIRLLVLDEARQCQPAEMRKNLLDRLAGMRIGGEHRDIHARMAGRQAHEIGARVARGSDDANPDLLCGHDRSFRPPGSAPLAEVGERQKWPKAYLYGS